MKQPIKVGFTDYSALVFIPDPASTDGSGKTALVAANLTVSYARVETDNDVTVTDVTSSLNNLAALTSTHNDWGLLEVSSSLAPGLYRLDFADAVFASGAWTAVVYVMITTSAAAASPMEFVLVAYDINDGVRLGLTSLPNAAAEAAGGLYTRGTGAGQMNQPANGSIDVNAKTWNGLTTVELPLVPVTAGRKLAVAVGGEASATIVTGGVIAGAFAAAEINTLADGFLDRNMGTGTDSGTDSTAVRTVRQALRRLRNKEAIVAGVGTVTKENDTTASWTYAAATTAGDPLSSVDPT